ncbi:hypothetical protein AcV5_002881 [Taiwanofungus camphoratus]|nr:hypothetical protein AcV5_002881 [Antrodia cinnamomea]KAI0925147.1 hypothetical protein AcW2_005829 [Antrodia cinnamomea]
MTGSPISIRDTTPSSDILQLLLTARILKEGGEDGSVPSDSQIHVIREQCGKRHRYPTGTGPFDPEKHKFRDVPDWESPKLYAIGRSKRAFLSESAEWQDVFASPHSDRDKFTLTWPRSLRRMFPRLTFWLIRLNLVHDTYLWP